MPDSLTMLAAAVDDLLGRVADLEARAQVANQALDTASGVTFSSVNVGTTGAPAGEVRASSVIRANSVTDGAFACQTTASVAINGKVTLALTNTPAGGLLMVMDGNSRYALFILQGARHATTLVSDPNTIYTITATTAGKTNIYWNGTAYELENKTAGAQQYFMTFIGN